MRRVILAMIVLFAIITFSVFHEMTISDLEKEVSQISGSIQVAYEVDDWEKVSSEMDKLICRWERDELWVSMTLKTAAIEEIDVSLEQSCEYAKLESKEDFIGEFSMFKKLIEHLPRQEGISLGDLL